MTELNKIAKSLKDLLGEMTKIRQALEKSARAQEKNNTIAEESKDLLININEWCVSIYNQSTR